MDNDSVSVRSFINPKFPFFWHGGDYNPDQWRHIPGAIDLDFRLMKEAGINSISIGIFAWTALEPEEGRFEFGWLDEIMNRAAEAGMAVVLATPSGAKPNWMASAHPEIRRMRRENGSCPPYRQEQHGRHNHCASSPYYRQKTAEIDRRLAERYASHPALALFHIGNEFSGECHCPLCFEKFRAWLRNKYKTLDALNQAWWTSFWSHTFTDWNQIVTIDTSVEAMELDWRRFSSENNIDFIKAEADVLHAAAPGIPVTTNLMGFIRDIDYWKLAPHLDVISWDAYPAYHDRPEDSVTSLFAMLHDFHRSLLNKPFILMESSPGPQNWMPINRLLRPGQHRMKSFQAIAHGSDTVQYFQIRKGRGGSEKFHGAVIDHCSVRTPETRMFREVKALGEDLQKMTEILGSRTPSRAAVVLDWESRWALEESHGPSEFTKHSERISLIHYDALRRHGVCLDVVNTELDFSRYDLVVLPQLYLLRPGFAEKARAFVENGGTIVATYMTGWVNETHLTFDGGFPGDGLQELFGIWEEETDFLYGDERNEMVFTEAAPEKLRGKIFPLSHVCSRIHVQPGTHVLATYGKDFYAGEPVLTCKNFGKGKVWYIGAHLENQEALSHVYAQIADDAGLPRFMESQCPSELDVTVREAEDGTQYLFILNPTGKSYTLDLGEKKRTYFFSPGKEAPRTYSVAPYSSEILRARRME